MRKNVKRLLCGLLAAALLIPAAAAAPASGQKAKLSDIQGHWAEQQIEQAVAEGWVDGYPDGSFHPDDTITQAEFTKMLLAAFRLTPDSETVTWMWNNKKWAHDKGWTVAIETYYPALTDMNTHWLTKQGWLKAAYASGVLIPADYDGGKYGPDLPVRRYTIALQTIRAMGMVSTAQKIATDDLTYSDNAQIQDWVKGYVKVAAQNNVMSGYPDGSFGPKRTATRAEAVVTILRALAYNKGDGEIQANLHVEIYSDSLNKEPTEVVDTKNVRMLAADGRIYANLLDLFDAYGINERTDDGEQQINWLPIQQVVLAGSGALHTFQMGNSYWEGGNYLYWYNEPPTPDRGLPLLGPVRSYYGQPMLPIYDFNRPATDENGRGWASFQADWDPATKTLSTRYAEPTHYVS